MDIILIFAITFLTVLTVNIVDWAVARGPLCWFPSGRLWNACLAGMSIAALGILLGWFPHWTALASMPPFIFQQVGSIWMRHTSRKAAA